MKSGYDQFFIKAKKNATQGSDYSMDESGSEPVTRKYSKYAQAVLDQREKNKKNKKKFPIVSIFSFAACILVVLAMIEKFDDIESYISKIEIGLGTAQAETVPAEAKAVDAKPLAAITDVKAEATSAEVTKLDENSDYLFKLAERKKELDTREEDLNKKTLEIAKQKTEIETKLKELENYREKISTMLKERITTDSGKVDNLVQVYTNMKPSQAAKIFETMDEDLVIEILSRMKKKSAADILNIVKADKAQIFSERYAGYRAPAQAKVEPSVDNKVNDIKTNETEMKPKP
jgi:flagellar motility protein MotE (MotC chaperone)